MLLLLAGCASCIVDTGPTDEPDTRPPGPDTGDTGDTAEDTGDLPIARCTLEEVEDDNFYNDYASPLVLPLDTWACGYVDVVDDVDYFTFTTRTPGWLEIDAQAASRGSAADLAYIVTLDAYDESVKQDGRAPRGTDPLNVFYSPYAGEYLLALAEVTGGGGGESYPWWLVVSETKAPVTWDMTEVEPNDSPAEGLTVVDGLVYYGTLGSLGDDDYYALPIPADARTLTCEVQGGDEGSAANLEFTLYFGGSRSVKLREYGTDARTDSEDPWAEFDIALERELMQDRIDADRAIDPLDWPEGSVDTGRFDLRVHDYEPDVGSMFHWYTLTCAFSSEEK